MHGYPLKLVSRAFAREIGDSCHSQVTYHFPSTVSFIDIQSRWPQEKVESLRYVHLFDTPVPLYPMDRLDCYTTHGFNSALALFPGRKLDTLTVESIRLHPNGEGVDGWCLGAAYHALENLVSTRGWKHLYCCSGILGLEPAQRQAIEDDIAKLKFDWKEDDRFGRIRPQTNGIETHHVNGTITSSGTDEERLEVTKWYADHPEEGPERGLSQ